MTLELFKVFVFAVGLGGTGRYFSFNAVQLSWHFIGVAGIIVERFFSPSALD